MDVLGRAGPGSLARIRAARGSPARPLEVLEPGRSAQQEQGDGDKWLPPRLSPQALYDVIFLSSPAGQIPSPCGRVLVTHH